MDLEQYDLQHYDLDHGDLIANLSSIYQDLIIEKGYAYVYWSRNVEETDEIDVVVRRDFLEKFSMSDRILVADEILGPCWGRPLYGNVDGMPYWVTRVRYRKSTRGRIISCLSELEKACQYLSVQLPN
jgi:hypothetical protein